MRNLVGIIGEMMFFIMPFMALVGCESCQTSDVYLSDVPNCGTVFGGDSTVVLLSNKPQNGYDISILYNKDICLIHFQRGDSINRYCALHELPSDLRFYEEDSAGVFKVDMNFPVFRGDTLGGSEDLPDMFFMDVNFDDEEEFVVKHEGYNRFYFACFDLVKGNRRNSCPGMLESLCEAPFNNIVAFGELNPCHTVFDRTKREIYIYETMGCCSLQETWAKYFEGDMYGNESQIKVTKQEYHSWRSDGTENIETYKLINNTLKLVSQKNIPPK